MDDSNNHAVTQLEVKLAKLRAEYASSWALHTKDDFERNFSREIKNEIQNTMMKWAIGAVVLLAGTGTIFVKYAVIQTFKEENSKLVQDFYQKYDAQLDLLRANFEWRRFHDFGKDYVYLAQLYADSPVAEELRAKRITENFNEAEQYFRRSLQYGDMHASTYWELGELLFTYPQKLKLPNRLDAAKAIERYKQAVDRYTQVEVDAGWRAEAYLLIAKTYLYLAQSNPTDENPPKKAKEFLLKANSDFAALKDQTGPRTRANIEEVQKILLERK